MLALIGVRDGDCNYFTFSMETNVNNVHNSSTNMDNIFCPAEMAEMAENFPLFRYFSVSSVIDKDNSQSDWRKDFYNGRNGNYRKINGKGYVFRIK